VSQTFLVTVNAIDDPPGPIELVEPAQGATFPTNQPLILEALVANPENDLES
jgi:hypothetical protein